MQKPWFIDVLTYVLVGVWMAWTFATIQQYGPSPALLTSAVVVLAAGLFLIYNQRVAYFRIGDYVVFESRDMTDGEQEPDDWQRENR
jgi:hypothetical protein